MPFPFQIIQSNAAVFMSYEYAGAVRHIYLKDPGPPQIDSWMGISHGVWEGDTFVVHTAGFNDQSWFDRAGNHHSDKMKVTERYTMTDADHINYEATIDDPVTFTQAVEDEHAALSPRREERAARPVQVRRVRD